MSSNFKNLYTSNNPPLQATLIRGSNIESIHKIHAVITDKKGRVLMCAGNPEYKSFIRSALKPFQAIPFVSSGASSKINNDSKSIALACGSHSGSKHHSREAFKILWEYDIDINKGIDKLLKKLKKIYFKRDVLKYILPEEIIKNTINEKNQILIRATIKDFFVFGQENMLDFDNSMNSFVGCCSLGTGHVDSFIK